MKLSRPSPRAVLTASVSAGLATMALRGVHRRSSLASGQSSPDGDLPDVGTVLARSADRSAPPDHHPRRRGKRALVELELEAPVPRAQEESAHDAGEEDGGGAGFPALEESTVMFLHIFKCAGSTLRRMLVDWAIVDGEDGAIVVSCDHPKKEDKICLNDHQLLNERVQEDIMSRQKVLAGHFVWGFQRHVKGPYLMITSLRNPLEVFVSGKQYIHPDKVQNLDQAEKFMSQEMFNWLARDLPGIGDKAAGANSAEQEQRAGFIFRLSGEDKNELKKGHGLVDAAHDAIRNLEEFWVVGVVEQYGGFLEVLRSLLDPEKKHKEHWNTYSKKHLNSSPVQTRDILAAVDPELVRRFNGSLALQWEVYEKAVSLWDVRCRQVLPHKKHRKFCTVPPPLSTYR